MVRRYTGAFIGVTVILACITYLAATPATAFQILPPPTTETLTTEMMYIPEGYEIACMATNLDTVARDVDITFLNLNGEVVQSGNTLHLDPGHSDGYSGRAGFWERCVFTSQGQTSKIRGDLILQNIAAGFVPVVTLSAR